MPENPQQQTTTFKELGVNPEILRILEQKKFTVPTPIQHQAIPRGIEGRDIVGIAQTGTGKTFAFGIPMLQQLMNGQGRGLIVVPTRELAYQVEESLNTFAPALRIRTAVLVGGASMYKQREMIRQNPRVVIATPGRLNDHLQQGSITLKEVRILVLDEADRMLDMGFKPQIDRILVHVPRERQTMLFSATMPREIMRLASSQMKLPISIEVAPAGTTVARVEQELFILHREEKVPLLAELLKTYSGTVLVFSRTKHGAKKLTKIVRDLGHTSAEIHSNRSLAQRREALEGFKSGRYRVLIATDIAARGIDVTGIQLVLNFDLPDDPADYVHRIGRTARAGQEGRAISFALPDQSQGIKGIERLIRSTLRRSPLPPLTVRTPPPSLDTRERDDRPARGYHSHDRNSSPHRRRSFGRRSR